MRFYLLNLYIGRVLLAVIADALCFAAAAAVTWWVLAPPFDPALYAGAAAFGAALAFVALYYTGAYNLTVLGSDQRTLSSVLATMGIALIGALVVFFGLHTPPRVIEAMAHVAGLYFPVLVAERIAFRFLSSLPRLGHRVLVIGASELGVAIADAMRERRNLGTDLVGFLSDDPADQGATVQGFRVLGKAHQILKIAERERISRIVVASKSRTEYFPAEELLLVKLRGIRIESGVAFYERVTGRVYLRDLRPSYLIFSDDFRVSRISTPVKRMLDLVVATIGLLLALPVLALCALAVRLDSPGPVLYPQERVGWNGRLFRLWKLRSMRHRAEEETGPVWTNDDDDRVTRVGGFLRKTRLDELPQLWNVLRGEMSLVGPRPERPEFVDTLSERYPYFRFRSTLKPGITGWAQIRHGYVNAVEGFEEKLALDLYYMKYRSLAMDLLILWKTAKTVILFHGV